jgi:hypothetical protein
MWDVPVITQRTKLANRPDVRVVLNDKKREDLLTINVAIPDDSNVRAPGTEKQSKYKDLEIEFSRMWKVRTKLCQL